MGIDEIFCSIQFGQLNKGLIMSHAIEDQAFKIELERFP